MPELAEVDFFRKRWNPGLGHKIERVLVHEKAGIFKTCDPALLKKHLTGASLRSSETAAKQMLFRAGDDLWLGIHLGMTGELSVQPANYVPLKRDHLVLIQHDRALVFADFRMFGRVQFHVGSAAPDWWTDIAPAVLSPAFTTEVVAAFLKRRARTPIKAVLLMQERFPGIGNWMADEILWRAALHPKRLAGSLTPSEIKTLHRETRWVAEHAFKIIGDADSPTLVDPPKTWLFPHRWENGGQCPKTGALLVREEVGGRTTCWSPARQKLR
ncbi:MAG TPA: DNA-formamidopyrimidine glycosylase family protein [Rariglobus sp.]|jgi:formamidopyrimidine-DNA glycosylase|nr:DNA-formamidopyrimidine glycosylase family protein [Rariglobus sp.]